MAPKENLPFPVNTKLSVLWQEAESAMWVVIPESSHLNTHYTLQL